MENKRGFTTLTLLGVIFISLVIMVILGILIYGAGIADNSFSLIEIDFGNNITFSDVYSETLQPGLTSAKTTMPTTMSTGILLGMILCMMIVAYNTKRIGKLWLVLDIAIIIIAEMGAVLVISSFTTFINSSPEMLQIFSTTLSTGSKYILNLHLIVPTIGVIIMIVTHIIGKSKEEIPRF